MAAKTHQIDIEAAMALWQQHRNWRTVAELLPPAANGHRWTQMSIYLAVWRTNRLPLELVTVVHARRRKDTGLRSVRRLLIGSNGSNAGASHENRRDDKSPGIMALAWVINGPTWNLNYWKA